jgi:tetratricopeptide (TPR) repeat protein
LTAEESALLNAEFYERLGEFLKAEQEFVNATKAADPRIRARALAGIERALGRARQATAGTALSDADAYVRREEWDRALESLSAASRIATGDDQRRAIQGLQTVEQRLSWKRRAERFDAFVLWLGRIAAVALVTWWISRLIRSIRASRRSIKVFPFVAPKEEEAQEMAFWFALVRSKFRGAAPMPGAVLMVSYNLPYVDLPGLPSDVPEIDDPTVGDTKLPLKDFMTHWGRPLVRISGGWSSAVTTGRAYAEVERRRFWHGYSVRSSVSRSIAAGAATDLELFSYDVLIRASEAHDG